MITKTNNRTLLAVSGTTYDFDFRIDDATELEVYGITAGGVSTELTTGFSISFDTANEEGTVTFLAEPSTYAQILMLRNRAYTQDTDIPIRGGFSEEDIENALDQIVIQIQQLKELTDYSVKQDPTAVAVNVVLPAPEDGLALVWDGTSGAMQNAPIDAGAVADAVTAAEAAQAAAEAAAASIATFASQAEAEAGTVDDEVMSPLRTAQAIAALGLSESAWTNYSSSSTIVGFSSTSNASILYKKIGKVVFVVFQFDGTSNSASLQFTLPYANASVVAQYAPTVNSYDNGAALTTGGVATMSNASSQVNLYKDTAATVGWTASNRKACFGQFWYITS